MAETKLADHIPEIKGADYVRGEKFMQTVRSYLKSMVEMPFEIPPIPYNFPYKKVYLFAQPLIPIERNLISNKYHKGSYVYETSTSIEPMLMQEFKVGLKSDNFVQTDTLLIEGSSPYWEAENGRLAHFWRETYSFNPEICRLAIVEATNDWIDATPLQS